jgi:hypothetical protein
MKKTLFYVVLVILISSVAVSCTSGAKIGGKGCGCNMNKGYVGY